MNAKIFGILSLLIALSLYLALSTDSFMTGNNIENMLRRTATYGILGIGVAFVIITSGIDLSIGSIVCLSASLLAVFLDVDYQPVSEEPVLAVQADPQRILLPAGDSQWHAGDRVRYYGGRRARTALLKINDVQQTEASVDGVNKKVTAIGLEGGISRDDTHGAIARIYEITAFQDEKADTSGTGTVASVTIAGDHSALRKRDKLTLVNPKGGVKTIPVLRSERQGEATRIELDGGLGSGFSKQWSAIPVARQQRMSVPAAIGLVLAIGALLGMIHGLFITKANLQPFVVTLCGLLIYRGFARWLVDDQVQGFGNEYDSSLGILANGKLVLFSSADGTPVFGVPYMFFIMVITAILAAIFLNRTIWGRYIRALGRNEEAARYSGINTHRMIILAYIICTVLATVGGMLFAVDANSISPSGFGNFYELYAIAAAVLGGCSLRGGEGGIFGVVIGTAVMQLLKNLIVLKHINQTLEFVIIGVVLLVGVTADELIRRLVARRRAVRQAKRLLEQQGAGEALATKPSDSP